ncbi:MAG: bifunctional diaminohydroxyphosphoribosylaminopyrimidine deaminase/5-amino-6-(5-phosphoribosylamino)uracil reductase RibD [Burkholderiaceae bacterium]
MTTPSNPWLLTLALAEQATGLTDPNPRVGCLIVSADGGAILGQGHTQAAGGPHAEVMALRDAAARGADVRGATVYVTLEPCAHHGRTPPCCDALVAAGVGRVEIALGDPNPLVNGQGTARIAAAGIAVGHAPPEVAARARDLNIGFMSRMERGRSWVRLKVAASLDGRTALPDGTSKWITSPEARADGHGWRRRAGAVLTGVGTVLADDPSLDVRLVPTARQPLRAVVDARLDTPPAARLLAGGSPVLLYTCSGDEARRAALAGRGAQLVDVPALPDGRADLHAVLDDLAAREVNELHVEAGARLNGALLATGRVDELLLYLAPTLLGPGRDMADFGPLRALADGFAFEFESTARVGPDLRILARKALARTAG